MVYELLKRSARVDVANKSGCTALHYATMPPPSSPHPPTSLESSLPWAIEQIGKREKEKACPHHGEGEGRVREGKIVRKMIK